ncbi:hypothetical protein K8942_04170 [Candidatus Peribacteria bacterium]|nr:MAG: hypothetical protein K8942_04170 [Candidatus Peribacteria bacterium]
MSRIFSVIGAALTSLLVAVPAYAVTLPSAPCSSEQFGCGGGAANIIMSALTGDSGIAITMLRLAAGLAVLFIIWAGVQMVISLGDEGKLSQYKWGMAYALIGFCVSILSEFIISTVGTENYGQIGGGTELPFVVLANAVAIMRTVLNALFLMILVVAGLRMLYAQGKSDEYETGKKMLTWALVGAVLVNLSAALVNAVIAFFGLN